MCQSCRLVALVQKLKKLKDEEASFNDNDVGLF